jgi:hypothetical protein
VFLLLAHFQAPAKCFAHTSKCWSWAGIDVWLMSELNRYRDRERLGLENKRRLSWEQGYEQGWMTG